MTNRQPKGTPVGGQFSEGRKPEGGDLYDEVNDSVEVEEFEGNLTASYEGYVFTISPPDPEAHRAHWTAEFRADESSVEQYATKGEFASFEEATDLFKEWPAVVKSMTHANDGLKASAGDLELTERLNDVHILWQEFDDNEQLYDGEFEQIYAVLDEATRRLDGDPNDPTSTNAKNLELSDKVHNAHILILNFDKDGTAISRDDFDYITEAIEEARETLGAGGPHGAVAE
jgi:hypothetical protein